MNLDKIELLENCLTLSKLEDTIAFEADLHQAIIDAQTYLVRHYRLLDYDVHSTMPLPSCWNKVFHNQWISGHKWWTVTLSILETPKDLASVANSVSGRAPTFTGAYLAAVIRACQKHHEMMLAVQEKSS